MVLCNNYYSLAHTEEPDYLMKRYDSSTRGLYNILKLSVNGLSRDIYRCDPDEHEQGTIL